ncbi:MAG: NfeD family protein [Desulfurococcaceae archaeon]
MVFARKAFLILLVIVFASHVLQGVYSTTGTQEAILVKLEMNIDGGAVSYIESVVEKYPGKVLIIELNSYGGYLASADEIITLIERSGSQCVAWIPPGGYAVSAAALLSLSCREIYMSPGGVIGGLKPSPEEPKLVEYIKSRVISLLERQGKENITWIAEEMVNKAKFYSTKEAVSIGLAKYSESLDDILSAEGLVLIDSTRPSSWDQLISLISNPLISQLLLLAGIILVLIEIFTTGFQGYGVAGALMILLALYGMSIIGPELLNLSLILAGAVLLAIELFTPEFGLFGISGLLLITIGFTLTTIRTPRELISQQVLVVIAGLAMFTGLFIFIGFKATKVSRIRRPALKDQLVNSIGIAKTDISETTPGTVYVLREDWTAYSTKGIIPAGSKVKVVRVEGLKLFVEKYEE